LARCACTLVRPHLPPTPSPRRGRGGMRRGVRPACLEQRYKQRVPACAATVTDHPHPRTKAGGGVAGRKGAAAGVPGGSVTAIRPRSRSLVPNAEQYWGRAVRPSLFSLDAQAQAVSSPGSIAGKTYHTLPPGSLVRGTTGLRLPLPPHHGARRAFKPVARRGCRCFRGCGCGCSPALSIPWTQRRAVLGTGREAQPFLAR
jgi:hypothetical protein